ncbi:acyl carrier protein [Paenibacillus sp. FSL H7-0716]|uniref:acyl carrier protein n=1 Tax=Paenibacillus TaxID=44249 RepID=UPI0015C3DA3B|nr:acyl carrier protein [Paenibacillus odorifer]
MTIPQSALLEQLITKKLCEVFNRTVEVGSETDLRDEGLDSLKMIALIVSIEVEFDIQIDDDDLLIDNFSSIKKIAILLSGKYGEQ